MNLPKQFINLLGAVLAIAIVIAGVALIALPMYGTAQATLASARTVEQTNDTYQMQVDALTVAAASIDQTDANVAELRTEITAIPQLDDVHEIIAAAAEDTDATVMSTVASDPVTWVERLTVDDAGLASAEAPASDTTDAAADGTDESTESTDTETTTTTEDAPASTAPADGPQQQVPIAITVEVKDAEAAADFIDALGAGPRLIGVEKATLTGSSGAMTLTVSALAFIRTEE
ncbi:hypothetical protein ACFQRL_13490 [Microbacterium fluvii]|uniref:Tfp pilus assembly protein PilO n=1 Tax=Microbacterium fluvii TaxID=415215 RepID=A0ABW2HF79_9MICO|nr:hypothetical protein [Microbacterium fluvii]MCU4673603.1 hypothetical protein [Microbacterium fluvii]